MRATPTTPASVILAAVFLFVYAGLLLACGVCGAGSSALGMAMQGQNADQARMQAMMDKEAPGHQVVQWGQLAMHFVIAFIMIGAGIGVLYWSQIARLIAYLAIALELLTTCGGALFQMLFVMPVTEKFIAEAMRQQQQKGAPPPPFDIGAMVTGLGIFGVVIAIVIKLGLLTPPAISLSMPGARAAFSGELAGTIDDDDGRASNGRAEGDEDDDFPPSLPTSPDDTRFTDRS